MLSSASLDYQDPMRPIRPIQRRYIVIVIGLLSIDRSVVLVDGRVASPPKHIFSTVREERSYSASQFQRQETSRAFHPNLRMFLEE